MNIVARRAWGANSASLPKREMRLPADQMWLHHTVTPVSKHPYADMRAVERVGLERFGQFPYSWCVHPDGTIMTGAGLRRGAHTKGRNSTSFGVALIGNYQDRGVTVWQLDAVRWLVARLVAAGELRPGAYPTGGHRDLASTACPGDKAYRLLDVFRIPWDGQHTSEGTLTVADNPDLHNITGPVTYTFAIAQDGTVKGYYCWSATSGELHAYGDVPYHGRSEVVT